LSIRRFRNGKWDLPKGGIEEERRYCNEVEEEGVNQLRVQKNSKTYHIFKRNGKYKLKITHWFEMESILRCAQGQLDEGIEK
jgi:hypothetical protein